VCAFVHDEEAVLALARKSVDWFAANGRKGERFGEPLARVGFDAYESSLLDEVKRIGADYTDI